MIDQEHGAIGPEHLHAMIAATASTKCRPLVRVGKRDVAMVKLALRAKWQDYLEKHQAAE